MTYINQSIAAVADDDFFQSFKTRFSKQIRNRLTDVADLAVGNNNFLCYCASRFRKYVEQDLVSDDEWRIVSSLFLLLSSDFLSFVAAYRACDAIKIELAYDRFAPVWRVTGSTRYLERVWRQQESLYTKFRFRQLQIARINRCSRPYHGSTGKHAHAKDEKMELFNADFSRFKMPRTKGKFVDDSKQVFAVKKARSTVNRYYSLRPLKAYKKPPRSASKKVDNPQLNFIYELLVKMGTMDVDPGRKMSSTSILKCSKKCTTPLKLNSVDDRMKDNRVYDSDKILSTLRQCILEKPSVDTSDMTEEDKTAIEDEENEEYAELNTEFEDDRIQDATPEDIANEDTVSGSKSTRGFNTKCLINVWKKGKELIRDDNIKESREHKTRRYAREKKLMEAIGDLIKNAQNNKRNTRLEAEVAVMEKPDWLKKCSDVSRF